MRQTWAISHFAPDLHVCDKPFNTSSPCLFHTINRTMTMTQRILTTLTIPSPQAIARPPCQHHTQTHPTKTSTTLQTEQGRNTRSIRPGYPVTSHTLIVTHAPPAPCATSASRASIPRHNGHLANNTEQKPIANIPTLTTQRPAATVRLGQGAHSFHTVRTSRTRRGGMRSARL